MKYMQFTKRTNEPKLSWLEQQLTDAGIEHQRNGQSFHAPILDIDETKESEAWKILTPVDDIPDDDERFITNNPNPWEADTYF